MKISFLATYGIDENPLVAQYDLLGYWKKSIADGTIPYIKNARVVFNDYAFCSYPDVEKVKKGIVGNFKSEKALHKRYLALNTELRILELVIEVNEEC